MYWSIYVYFFLCCVFFFKQKTAYEMRISDWSSDVCSSDLPIPHVERAEGALLHLADGGTLIDCIASWWVTTHGHCHPRIAAAIADQAGKLDQLIFAGYTHGPAEEVAQGLEIGRASCRERVCQYV